MSYEPTGIRFTDALLGEMLLSTDKKSSWYHWLFYRHRTGNWVSFRKATEDDLARLAALGEKQGVEVNLE